MRPLRSFLDVPLLLCPIALSLIGIAFIYSATATNPEPAGQGYYLRQIVWFGVGLLAATALFFIPLKVHEAMAYVYYVIAIGALILVLLITKEGAARWFTFGGFAVQPVEFAKFTICAVMARFFTYNQLKLNRLTTLAKALIAVLIPTALVIKQPDLGSSLVGLAIFFVMLIWSGMPLLRILLILSPLVSLLAAFHWLAWAILFIMFLILLYIVRPGVFVSIVFFLLFLGFGMATPYLWNKLHDYQRQRILTFLDPGRDPKKAGYQVIQSKIAIGSGGLWGRGYMKGTQTKLDYLPAQHTDFIYSVVSEETGFLGSSLVLLLFSVIIVRGFVIAYKARNPFNSYMAAGLSGALAFQGLVNIGMTLGLLPVTGVPLPFVSYGGSSMLFNWSLIGVIQAVGRDWQEY